MLCKVSLLYRIKKLMFLRGRERDREMWVGGCDCCYKISGNLSCFAKFPCMGKSTGQTDVCFRERLRQRESEREKVDVGWGM